MEQKYIVYINNNKDKEFNTEVEALKYVQQMDTVDKQIEGNS